MRGAMKGRGGFVAMVGSVLGLVLFITMFSNILSALEAVRIYANIATFVALETVVEIAPTILLLGGVALGGYGYAKGLGASARGGGDAGGLLRMVLGVLVIILFATLFLTILAAFYTLYGADNAAEYTAFQTTVTILPTVIFLAGLFAGGATTVSGYRARRRRRHLK